MKLSTAIRRGCEMRPRQSFGLYYDGADGACAIGAALVAYGCDVKMYAEDIDEFMFSVDTRSCERVTCPEVACGHAPFGSKGLAIHLNDDHRWPRERIADFLEGEGY